jgi:hypothetical protein
MGQTQTKGIAIRVDYNLFTEIENHELSRNDLITKALESYLHPTKKTSKLKPTKTKESSTWSKIEEDAKKINTLNTEKPKEEPVSTETITNNLYLEIYSTIYNTEVSPLKKQIELKNELITTLKQQNKIMQEDKNFLHEHITNLEQHIPKKHAWIKRKK